MARSRWNKRANAPDWDREVLEPYIIPWWVWAMAAMLVAAEVFDSFYIYS